MKRKSKPLLWRLFPSFLLISSLSPSLLISLSPIATAQTPSLNPAICREIVSPLSPEEQMFAREAWQYFINNYNPETGFTNSVNAYPSGTLWDMGNYLMALNAAKQLGLIEQGDFDSRLNKFLETSSRLPLFENTLPNKVYNTATAQTVDYGNNVLDRGIGWSALDIGRILAAFHVIRTCHPQYEDWIKDILGNWNIEKSVQDEKLYGATVLPDGQTLLVQEGRLGYEEYAARGYELWGYSVPQAISLDPFKLVEVNGVQIPVDQRDFQQTNANNYVVSESYILDAIEFGLEGSLAQYAPKVLEAQRRRYEETGELTAVTEDNIDRAPYFLYNTVYANGKPWATITENNQDYPELRTFSTKAALGWYFLYPDDPYAQKLYEAAKNLRSPDGGGFWAGMYQETNQPNAVLTGNTNGLVLEMLYFKARGRKPLIGGANVTFDRGNIPGDTSALPVTPPPSPQVSEPPQSIPRTPINAPTPSPTRAPSSDLNVNPVASLGAPQPSACPKLGRPLSVPERRYGAAAWQYFETNYNPNTGLVRDRADMNATSLWGMGDYISALHAARSLEIITPQNFDLRVRKLLGAMERLPLFAGQLPHRGYSTTNLTPIDYGANPSLENSTNPSAEGTGWSAYDIGRMLTALHTLKTCYPQYQNVVDEVVLEWNFMSVVQNGMLFSGTTTKDSNGRQITRTEPASRFGYQEYAARGFALWGFDTAQAEVGGNYSTTEIEGVTVPIGREGNTTHVTTDPFVQYGLEFGFDPEMSALVKPILEAQSRRYERTGQFTAATTTLMPTAPYIIHNSIINKDRQWATVTDTGEFVPNERVVGTAVAFSLYALFPNHEYTPRLWNAVTDLYNPRLGYYEGYTENTGRRAGGFSSSTNSVVLQSLLHLVTDSQPLVQPEASRKSPWWRRIAAGDLGQGLPQQPQPTIRLQREGNHTAWVSKD